MSLFRSLNRVQTFLSPRPSLVNTVALVGLLWRVGLSLSCLSLKNTLAVREGRDASFRHFPKLIRGKTPRTTVGVCLLPLPAVFRTAKLAGVWAGFARTLTFFPKSHVLSLTLFGWSRVTVCRVAVRASQGYTERWSLWGFVRPASFRWSSRSGRCLYSVPDPFGLWARDRACGNVDVLSRSPMFVPYSFWLVTGDRLSCSGTRIVATVHLPLFPSSDGRYGHMSKSRHRAPLVADSSVCPLSIPWFDGTSVVKDPLPVDEAVDLPCVELLNEKRTLIRKYSKTFLCLVGLSRSFVETDVHPTLLRDDEEMGLLDFVRVADPFKVKVGERTLAENEVPLVTETKDREEKSSFFFEPPPVKMARAEGIAISDSRPSTAGKSPTALRRLSRLSEQGDAGSGSVAPATEDVTSSSITHTPEHVLEDASHDNLRIRSSSGRFVVLSSGSTDTDIPTSPQVDLPANSGSAGINVPVAESAGDGHRSPGSGSAAGDLSANQDSSADRALQTWKVSALELECDGLKNQVVGEDEMREEFTSQQDATERRFNERAAELDARIADVRRDMDNDLYPHMLTAFAGRRWVVRHGFCLAVRKCARSIECQSALGKVISMAINKGIQQGLEAGVVHGKAGRSLTKIEAYDPEVEVKYVAAVSEFKGLSFPLLDELEGLKDSPLALIMSALTLKDGEGNKDTSPKFSQFQPSLDQVTVPIYSESGSICREMPLSNDIPTIRWSAERRGLCPPSGATPGETSGSVPLYDSSLGVADYQVSTLVLSGDGVPAGQPPVVEPHDDMFDTFVLDKPDDA
ncbi:hypothetical protein Tco_0659027 [Tanacetum coccineum]